jgi:hypothetical protein
VTPSTRLDRDSLELVAFSSQDGEAWFRLSSRGPHRNEKTILMFPEDLRWLVEAAGPALLAEYAPKSDAK